MIPPRGRAHAQLQRQGTHADTLRFLLRGTAAAFQLVPNPAAATSGSTAAVATAQTADRQAAAAAAAAPEWVKATLAAQVC